MECAVIVTYRCNAKCKMCHTWKHPSDPQEEITPEIIDKIPGGMRRLNITGGEPLLRNDIEDIVKVLDKKTKSLEISTNGYFSERILKIAERFPDTTFRVSIEGLPKNNQEMRGIKDGFDHALRTILRLQEMGVEDIGFGIVIHDKNAEDLVDLYHLCSRVGIEFSQASLHNSFYFHKHDNKVKDVDGVEKELRRFIHALLRSPRRNLKKRIKDWGRAYFNNGLIDYINGRNRSLPCGAATDCFFLDPWGNVLACNGSPEPWIMGNLKDASFDQIWHSKQADEVREKVRNCKRNCWMTGTAVPAMRKNFYIKPLIWILKNKFRLLIGKDIVV